jgi:lauroyl/myristoyl acyltransferase
MNQSLLSYYLYRALGFIAPLIPPRFGYWLASLLGTLTFYLYSRGAKAVKENLSHVLGEEGNEATIEATAREVFRNLLKNYYDLFHKHALSDEEISTSVTVVGLHHAEKALAEGKGVIATSGHFGPFDVLMQIAPSLNMRITGPAEHLKPEKLYQYLCRLRARDWITFLPVDGPLFGLFRALRRGEVVGLAADRDITNSGILMDFFGAPARLPDGHVQLAMRTGAKIVTFFGLRQADNSSLLHIEPPLELEDTGDFERDVRVNVRKVVARLEKWISRYPEQWLMLQPVWRDSRNGNGD